MIATVGFAFPSEYEEVVEKIRAGKCGEEWKSKTGTNTTDAVYNGWYSAVYVPGAAAQG